LQIDSENLENHDTSLSAINQTPFRILFDETLEIIIGFPEMLISGIVR
jgi:hypothetical protein